mgnify:CR=1 FL=1
MSIINLTKSSFFSRPFSLFKNFFFLRVESHSNRCCSKAENNHVHDVIERENDPRNEEAIVEETVRARADKFVVGKSRS